MSFMINNIDSNKLSERIIELSEHFSKRSHYWEEIYTKRKSPPNFMIYELDSRMEKVLSALDRFSKGKTLSILDVGCGTGHYIQEMLIRNHQVVGSDIAFGMLMKAKQKLNNFKNNSSLIHANIENLPFDDEAFDAIVCIGVIEYLPDPRKALKELNRLVKNEGVVIVSAPNLYSLKFILDPYYIVRGVEYILKKMGLNIKKKKQVINDVSMNHNFKNKRFRLKKLLKIFTDENFSVVNISPVAFGPVAFFQKAYFSLKTNIKINNYLVKLSNKKKFLSYFANRWVIELHKLSN